jgi:phage antirepressor YoqD-like protein
MSEIISQNPTQLAMSSREIAELTGKTHGHVKRDIETMMFLLCLDASSFGRIYRDSMNRPQTEYLLPKDETLCLLSGYDVSARMKIIKRWQELEEKQQVRVPQTLPEALRLAADLADKVEAQQSLIETQKPAVEFVERYVEARSAKSLREVAKVLGVKEREFINTLIDKKILFRQGGNLLPFADYQHRGYFTVKTGESNGHAFQQTRFTPEGINWICKRMGLIGGAV